MKKPSRCDIEGVAGAATDHSAGRRCRHATPAGGAGFSLFDLAHAADGSLDCAIAGTTTNVALQRPGKVLLLGLIEARRGHDHARRAEAALESLRLQESLLHRMQLAVLGQAFDGCDRAAGGAIGGEQARVYRVAVDQHGAGAAIAGVASFLHAETSELAQKRAQALPGLRLSIVAVSVHHKGHAAPTPFPASSQRISSANCSVTCRRHSGAPCKSA